jgi:multiple sugar transport system substrate-binding protein
MSRSEQPSTIDAAQAPPGRSKVLPTRRTAAVGIAASVLVSKGGLAQSQTTLTIQSDRNNPRQKDVFARIIKDFEAQNPGVRVVVNTSDLESYKTAIRNFLVTNPPDLAFWNTGERMRAFSRRGLFEEMGSFYDQQNLREPMRQFIPALTDDGTATGKIYGLPTSFSTWGFFYRKDIFERLNLRPAGTWTELMALAAALKQNGIVPFTIGTRDLWTNCLWHDYLSLRMHGLEYYQQLTGGEIPYTDPRVRAVFQMWREPIEKGYFLENHTSYGWQEAIPFLSQGRAATYLLNPATLFSMPEDAKAKLGFFRFPDVKPGFPRYEQVVLNGIFIPSGARNKELARKFLALFMQRDNLSEWSLVASGIPARTDAPLGDGFFVAESMENVRTAAGAGQFYDRDTDPDMAQIGMNGFQEFSVRPQNLDAILTRLEAARKRIYNK